MKSNKENLLGVLIEAGIGSRRKLAAAIMQGKVTVNGTIATNLRHPVDSRKDTIAVNGKVIGIKQEQHVYLMLNKPEGVLSTVSDERGRKTVTDLIPEKYRDLRLYPAGRLDKDTKGLLLLTNDGEFTNRITHPRYENEKEYYIRIYGEVKVADIKKLEKGIEIDGSMTSPAVVKEIRDAPNYNYSITIHEGRKRQVRRMFLHLGYRPLALKRVRIGNLTLGNLKEGEVRELSRREVILP
ncbi:pseudouridine synthase [Chloroflexota bacterium]